MKRSGLSDYLRAALAILVKDARCELRAKSALGAVLLFAVTSTVAVSFTLGVTGASGAVSAVLLWLVIYFSAMSGLSRTFVREEEGQTSVILRLAARPNSVYLGKLAFNLLVLLALELVAVPLFVVLMRCEVQQWGLFIALLLVGSLGLSVGATSAAAMVAKASAKGALFAVISFPLLIPALAAAIHGTSIALGGASTGSAASDLRLLAYYFGLVLTASLMLFRYIWEE